ncbi:MAG TPA: penicillin-binding protein 2, partial [Nocardioidaceae bacterium]|nr:penicillin-binding protein 2 [Nocardioidaceae bacterium]
MNSVLRGRLIVVHVLVLSLFITLFTRLWYVQVIGGDEYQAKAQNNAVRDVIKQPPRGLIVDDMGRPIAANRTSWVVKVNRDVLDTMDDATRKDLLRRLGDLLDLKPGRIDSRTRLCGTDGAPKPPRCWNGSPYEPVPVAEDVGQQTAVAIQERPEEFPGVTAEERSVRAYPSPYNINAAHVLGYLTPITAEEYEKAQRNDVESLNASSVVGRSGLEYSYDKFLRGMPGTTGKTVDAMGRVIGTDDGTPAKPGDTLVTSIDSRVQSVVERQLRKAIMKARSTHDKISGRNFEATSGAMIVLDPNDGRVVAMASYPTYDPSIWVGGVTDDQLERLYSKKAGEPLLTRPTQAQLSPGSTWKPMMTAGALTHGFSTDTRLNCSNAFQVGNQTFKNYESESYGMIGFDKALQVSCNTFFYRVGYSLWLEAGGNSAGADADAVLADMARKFGLGNETGIDLPGEADGRIADPAWKQDYYEQMKGYYCKRDKKLQKTDPGSYEAQYAHEFCLDGNRYRAGDAVNFVIGQGDTIITPIQLAVAYGALANGGTVWQPRVGKAVVDPQGNLVKKIRSKKVRDVPVPKSTLRYIDRALQGTSKVGTYAWKMQGFPLDQVKIRAKTGTAEVHDKQTTGWLATYDKNYVVVSMIEQGGTG